jgi:hypothetical protein
MALLDMALLDMALRDATLDFAKNPGHSVDERDDTTAVFCRTAVVHSRHFCKLYQDQISIRPGAPSITL